MPTPKRKLSRSRIGMRNAHKHIDAKPVTLCSNKSCATPTMPHEVCMSCGFYQGRKVLNTKADRELKRSEMRTQKEKKAESSKNAEEQQ